MTPRGLQKDPRLRTRDIGDVRIEIDEIRRGLIDGGAEQPAARRVTMRLAATGWGLALLLALIAGTALFVHLRERLPAPPETMRFQIFAPEKQAFSGTTALISPDGRQIVTAVRGADGRSTFWVRALYSLDGRRLEGAALGNTPSTFFWSPDSRFIGFTAPDGKLKKVDVSGGSVQVICDLPSAWRGGTWNREGTILFAGHGTGLWQVAQTGGAPSLVMSQRPPETVMGSPTFLPDGRHFLYTRGETSENAAVYVGSLDLKPEQQSSKPLLAAYSSTVYAPSSSDPDIGYILFLGETTLMAQPFNAGQLELAGEASVIAENVSPAAGQTSFSASSTGTLAFASGGAGDSSQLIWLDRQGKRLGQVGPPATYGDVLLSLDGRTAVVRQTDPATRAKHLFAIDLNRGVFSRLNPGNAQDAAPAISPDGRVAFSSTANGAVGDIYVRLASGAGEAELLVKSPTVKHPNHWSPDGRFVIYDDHTAQRQDLWIVPMMGDRKPIPFLVTPADEFLAQFSPDGKWIAYSSDESGRREVYVRDFAPDRVPATASGRWQISTGGGSVPRWRADGKQLYYLASDRKMMAVPVRSSPTFESGAAVPLFDTPPLGGVFPYDVTADGRFLINVAADDGLTSPITIVQNWAAGLKK
jgi:eukaryotic-like serine/threonine-protein kinase